MQLLIRTSSLPFWEATLIAAALLFLSDQIAVWYFHKFRPLLWKKA